MQDSGPDSNDIKIFGTHVESWQKPTMILHLVPDVQSWHAMIVHFRWVNFLAKQPKYELSTTKFGDFSIFGHFQKMFGF